MSISTITSTLVFLYLADKQRNANYPRRIINGGIITAVVFLLLGLSCFFLLPSDTVYFIFLLVAMFVSTVGTSYTQNGSYAVVTLYEPVYMQAIMVGQALSGIVPPLCQFLSALSYGSGDADDNNNNATRLDMGTKAADPVPIDTSSSAAQWSSFAYFIAATTLSMTAIALYIISIRKTKTLHEHDEGDYIRYSDEIEGEACPDSNSLDENVAFLDVHRDDASTIKPSRTQSLNDDDVFPELSRRHTHSAALIEDEEALAKGEHHTTVPLSTLFKKLLVPSITVYLVFTVTLAYPVFASRVLSTTYGLPPQLYIPLVFFIWNLGDLLGRIICAYPQYIISTDKVFIMYGVGRLLFIPLFLLFTISKDSNDTLYLLLHLLFGITNGHLCSSAFIRMPHYVGDTEREAGGGFMTLMLSLGLTTGSLFSFVLSAVIDNVSP